MYPNLQKQVKPLNKLGNITTPFGGKTRGESWHPGVDFANKAGTPIPAFADGVITGVGTKKDGFGNVVTMKDGTGSTHQYAHLQGAMVKPGMKVKKGQPIGAMGSSGGTSYSPSGGDASHLDIRIVSKYGQWKNPLTYVGNLSK